MRGPLLILRRFARQREDKSMTLRLRLVLDYARDILGMQRVTLRVFDHNTAARACYRKVGFREVSLEKESFPHGEVSWDCWNMEALL